MYRSKQFFRCGARGGNRTLVIGLEGRGNSHYTTRAFFDLELTQIIYLQKTVK